MSDYFAKIDLSTEGHYPVTLAGEVAPIEAILSVPENGNVKTMALIAHPHSLHGGTMQNKVVTTLSKALNECSISTLRFNFRGVGQSGGEFDKGIGESKDVLRIMETIKKELGIESFLLLGFSFGGYVMYRVASQVESTLLITVAPAVNHGNFSEFKKVPTPWYVLVAGKDEIVPEEDIIQWYQSVVPLPILKQFEGASHFFHGRLIELKKVIKDIIHHG